MLKRLLCVSFICKQQTFKEEAGEEPAGSVVQADNLF